MKAVICPICNGSGKRETQLDNSQALCHGCGGCGWVEVHE